MLPYLIFNYVSHFIKDPCGCEFLYCVFFLRLCINLKEVVHMFEMGNGAALADSLTFGHSCSLKSLTDH